MIISHPYFLPTLNYNYLHEHNSPQKLFKKKKKKRVMLIFAQYNKEGAAVRLSLHACLVLNYFPVPGAVMLGV